jgi:hypothetical protein
VDVGHTAGWVVTVSDGTGGPLYPGYGSETQTYPIKNNSSGDQALNSVRATVGNSVVTPSCLGSWFNATASDPTGYTYGTNIAPGAQDL